MNAHRVKLSYSISGERFSWVWWWRWWWYIDLTKSLCIHLSRWGERYISFFFFRGRGGGGVAFFFVFVVVICFVLFCFYLFIYLFIYFIYLFIHLFAVACVSDWRNITHISWVFFVIFMLIFGSFLGLYFLLQLCRPFVYSIGTDETKSTEHYLILEFAFVESNCRGVWW